MSANENGNILITALFASSPAPIVAIDRDGVVIAWNPAAERLFGWTLEEMLGHVYPLVPKEGECLYRASVDKVFRGESLSKYKAQRRKKNGTLVDVTVSMAPIYGETEGIVGALAIFDDITEQRKAEQRAERLNEVLLAIREVNRLIVHEKEADDLLGGICKCLLKYRGYNKAWIALKGESGSLVLRAQAGLFELNSTFQKTLTKTQTPKCIQKAIISKEAFVVEDRRQTCSGCPLENSCPAGDSIVARLCHRENVMGVLGLTLPAGFDIFETEKDLITEIANDVAFALHSLEVEEARRRTEDLLRTQEHDLTERLKELTCLYRITDLVEKPGITLKEIFEIAPEIIVQAWQFPEITCVRISLDGQVFKTSNFRQTRWKQSCSITVYDKKAGTVEVFYLEEKPEVYEGPFQKEERDLLRAVSERFGRIVERLRAEQILRESEEFLSTILRSIGDGVIATDNNGCVSFMNPTAEKLTGWPGKEATGRPIKEIFKIRHEQAGKLVVDPVERVLKEGVYVGLTNHTRLTRRDGTELTITESGAPIRDDRAEVNGVILVFQDVTERRKAEEDLKRAEAQTRLQQEQLMQADKMVALGTLVSGVGHEINNPNNFVMLNVPLLKGMWNDAIPIMENHFEENGDFRLRGIPFSKARNIIPELLNDIMEGSWRIKRIVGELKDYARLQPSKLTELLDINEVINSAVVLCKTFIQQHTQKFSTDYAADLPEIQGSRQRIEQVIINLLQNACEALQDNQRVVSISTFHDRQHNGIGVTVVDEGVGIADENLARLTDPFYTTKRTSGGTGLGLSIAERIIRDHKGFLLYDSIEGKGTIARVFLPFGIKIQQEESK